MRLQETNGLKAEFINKREQKALLRATVKGDN